MICFCGNQNFKHKMTYAARPRGETDFKIKNYYRQLHKCTICGHFISTHSMLKDDFYINDYAALTYPKGLKEPFEKIVALTEKESNNLGRVKRVCQYKHVGKLLDIGSGLCVFPYEMQRVGWDCTISDIDIRVHAHAKELHLREWAYKTEQFDLISFNNVLEHTKNPVRMLESIRQFIAPSGAVYVEVPDGEEASKEGYLREEFFVEHWHIFSLASAVFMAIRAGYTVDEVERLKEPSGIYTIRMFLKP